MASRYLPTTSVGGGPPFNSAARVCVVRVTALIMRPDWPGGRGEACLARGPGFGRLTAQPALLFVRSVARVLPAEEALLDLEDRVQGLLHHLGVPEGVDDRLRDLPQFLPNRVPEVARNRPDPVAVHLFELPQNTVGRVQHAVERIPALVVPPDAILQLA